MRIEMANAASVLRNVCRAPRVRVFLHACRLSYM